MQPRLAAVLGWPVSHSLSPVLHQHWFDRHEVDGRYIALPVRAKDLADAVDMLPRLGFSGWNVTLPHKERMAELVPAQDEAARRMRAVNTVLVQEDGSLFGLNTDGLGFMANLRQELARQAVVWAARERPVVLLGAGGAARAVAVAVLDQGVSELRIVNRSLERAEHLADALARCSTARIATYAFPRHTEALLDAGLCVNATDLGMIGKPPLEIDLRALPVASPVVDLVYVPLLTALLQQARQRGHPTVDGLGMLMHQAAPGFLHWGGVRPEVDEEARTHLLDALARRPPS